MAEYLVIATSLRPGSHSRLLAEALWSEVGKRLKQLAEAAIRLRN